MEHAGHKSPEQIEDEIRLTQDRIDARLSDLQTRLSPAELLAAVAGRYESSPPGGDRDAGERGGARSNSHGGKSLGAVLIGAGLSWVVSNLAHGQFSPGKSNQGPRSDDKDDFIPEPIDKFDFSRGGGKSKAGRPTNGAADGGEQNSSSGMTQTVSNTAAAISEKGAQYSRAAQASATQVAESLRDTGARSMAWVRDNPIPASLAGVAVGAALASTFAWRVQTQPAGKNKSSRSSGTGGAQKATNKKAKSKKTRAKKASAKRSSGKKSKPKTGATKTTSKSQAGGKAPTRKPTAPKARALRPGSMPTARANNQPGRGPGAGPVDVTKHE